MDTVLSSKTKTITIGADKPFCVIGERINPTSRKKFSEELREGNLDTVGVPLAQLLRELLARGGVDPLADDAERLVGSDRDRLCLGAENGVHGYAGTALRRCSMRSLAFLTAEEASAE